jgi:hypothetical protein
MMRGVARLKNDIDLLALQREENVKPARKNPPEWRESQKLGLLSTVSLKRN